MKSGCVGCKLGSVRHHPVSVSYTAGFAGLLIGLHVCQLSFSALACQGSQWAVAGRHSNVLFCLHAEKLVRDLFRRAVEEGNPFWPTKASRTGRDSNPSCEVLVSDSEPAKLWKYHVTAKEVFFFLYM